MDHETFPQGAPGADTPDALPNDRAPDAAPALAALPAPDAPDAMAPDGADLSPPKPLAKEEPPTPMAAPRSLGRVGRSRRSHRGADRPRIRYLLGGRARLDPPQSYPHPGDRPARARRDAIRSCLRSPITIPPPMPATTPTPTPTRRSSVPGSSSSMPGCAMPTTMPPRATAAGTRGASASSSNARRLGHRHRCLPRRLDQPALGLQPAQPRRGLCRGMGRRAGARPPTARRRPARTRAARPGRPHRQERRGDRRTSPHRQPPRTGPAHPPRSPRRARAARRARPPARRARRAQGPDGALGRLPRHDRRAIRRRPTPSPPALILSLSKEPLAKPPKVTPRATPVNPSLDGVNCMNLSGLWRLRAIRPRPRNRPRCTRRGRGGGARDLAGQRRPLVDRLPPARGLRRRAAGPIRRLGLPARARRGRTVRGRGRRRRRPRRTRPPRIPPPRRLRPPPGRRGRGRGRRRGRGRDDGGRRGRSDQSGDTASHQPPPPIADGPEPAAAQRLGEP